MSVISVSFQLNELSKLLSHRNLEERGQVQQYIDSEVMRCMDPRMPLDTHTMISSMITATTVGSGEIKVNTPYAHRRLHSARNNGLRGPNYFERMKADCLSDILRGAAYIAGGDYKK